MQGTLRQVLGWKIEMIDEDRINDMEINLMDQFFFQDTCSIPLGSHSKSNQQTCCEFRAFQVCDCDHLARWMLTSCIQAQTSPKTIHGKLEQSHPTSKIMGDLGKTMESPPISLNSPLPKLEFHSLNRFPPSVLPATDLRRETARKVWAVVMHSVWVEVQLLSFTP